jgi:hypothetical protein
MNIVTYKLQYVIANWRYTIAVTCNMADKYERPGKYMKLYLKHLYLFLSTLLLAY